MTMADLTAGGKYLSTCHFQVIIYGFQPVFHIHRLLIKGVYLSDIKVGSYNFV
jgi:hypothetical protein